MINPEEAQSVLDSADCLYSQQQVEEAMDRLAGEIGDEIGDKNPLVLCLMNGGLIFTGQLLTRMQFPLQIDYLHATRYRGETEGSELEWVHLPKTALGGRVVLILDDILDEGLTLKAVIDFCRQKGANRVLSAVLVEKELGREKPCRADFVGLRTGNRYLFGYGLDYKLYLRNANGIYACNE